MCASLTFIVYYYFIRILTWVCHKKKLKFQANSPKKCFVNLYHIKKHIFSHHKWLVVYAFTFIINFNHDSWMKCCCCTFFLSNLYKNRALWVYVHSRPFCRVAITLICLINYWNYESTWFWSEIYMLKRTVVVVYWNVIRQFGWFIKNQTIYIYWIFVVVVVGWHGW